MSARIVTEVRDEDRPLCPKTLTGPLDPLHAERVHTLDAFYDAADKDDEQEFSVPAVGEAYHRAAHDGRDRMRLYESHVVLPGPRYRATVAAWWWQCPVCGFVLPAVEVP